MIPFEYSKIIATVGPATSTVDGIRALIRAGADACRVNFSHGNADTLGPLMRLVREAAALENAVVATIADIQGPKLRIGAMPGAGALLVRGTEFTLTTRAVEGTEAVAQAVYEHLADDVERGARILLADGAIELEVEAIDGRDVRCRVLFGGLLFSHKGLTLPGRKLSAATLTEKDHEDLRYLTTTDVDMIAVSFVRKAGDLDLAREILGDARKIPLIAKLERPEALEHLDEILDVSDGIMVARGDLGVELPFERVPLLQKKILARATERGRFAIVATQMLASMVAARRPTRAEASDVMNAVLDGADAVMLSEETAIGENPALAVSAMDALIREAEGYDRRSDAAADGRDPRSFAAGAAGAAVSAATRLGARAIVILAGSGLSALAVSKWLPKLPILALSSSAPTLRRTNLLRGVKPLEIPHHADVEGQLGFADEFLLKVGWAAPDDVVVVVGAIPLGSGKEPNMIRFHRVRAGAT